MILISEWIGDGRVDKPGHRRESFDRQGRRTDRQQSYHMMASAERG